MQDKCKPFDNKVHYFHYFINVQQVQEFEWNKSKIWTDIYKTKLDKKHTLEIKHDTKLIRPYMKPSEFPVSQNPEAYDIPYPTEEQLRVSNETVDRHYQNHDRGEDRFAQGKEAPNRVSHNKPTQRLFNKDGTKNGSYQPPKTNDEGEPVAEVVDGPSDYDQAHNRKFDNSWGSGNQSGQRGQPSARPTSGGNWAKNPRGQDPGRRGPVSGSI
jgi:hypothetical protein